MTTKTDTEQQRADFDAWAEKRGVWPRLTHQEIFSAGYQAGRAALQSQNDISKLVKRLREADKPLMQQNTFSEVRALLREAAEALQSQDAEDAERYLWLRDKSRVFKQDPDMSGNHYWMIQANGSLRGASLDEAIDHARRIEGADDA